MSKNEKHDLYLCKPHFFPLSFQPKVSVHLIRKWCVMIWIPWELWCCHIVVKSYCHCQPVLNSAGKTYMSYLHLTFRHIISQILLMSFSYSFDFFRCCCDCFQNSANILRISYLGESLTFKKGFPNRIYWIKICISVCYIFPELFSMFHFSSGIPTPKPYTIVALVRNAVQKLLAFFQQQMLPYLRY